MSPLPPPLPTPKKPARRAAGPAKTSLTPSATSIPTLPSIAHLREQLIRGGRSALELLTHCRDSIERLNPTLNALPTLCLDRAQDEAKKIDQALHHERTKKTTRPGLPLGPLAGMPYCAKDIFETAGVRTTYGSPIFQHSIPKKDAAIVARLRQSGAVLIGKSNTPEFAAGSQTFNTIFGATKNPWDLARTCGGSTGGGAVALATQMTVIADGSDLAASLRNPASFCGITGLRPSSHLEPRLQAGLNTFNTLSMVGPLARNIADLREMFLAIFDSAGCAPRAGQRLADWASLRTHQAQSRLAAMPSKRKIRLGWAPDWGGLPLETAVAETLEAAKAELVRHGIELVEGFPQLPDYRQAFLTLRGEYFVHEFNELYQHHRASLKDTVVWNIEQGLALSCEAIAKAHKIRAACLKKVELYMREHNLDALAGATAQVLPFDLDKPFIDEINGHKLDTYVDWLASNFWVTIAGLPAVSLPAGFAPIPHATGGPLGQGRLPVGLQLVGLWGQDLRLLDLAEKIETHLTPLTRSSS